MDDKRLFLRRQFILGSHFIDNYSDWKKITFGHCFLTVHPDLETTSIKKENKEFVLLGFVLSHLKPEYKNIDILSEMCVKCNNNKDVIEYMADLCGRFVFLFKLDGKMGLINDLIGSRSVYYSIQNDFLWCASQPSTLAKIINMKEDCSNDIVKFIAEDLYINGEASWIGDGTKYVGVKHLLPNHYLDFDTKKAVRYWPVKRLERLDVESAAIQSASILKNTMKAAKCRFKLIQAITAGWDSRCLLAATKDIKDDIVYYIQKFGSMNNKHADIVIPQILARKIGLNFSVISCNKAADEWFVNALKNNVFVLHNPSKIKLYYNFLQQFSERVNMAGYIGEIGRTRYGILPVKKIEELLEIVNLQESRYAYSSLENWFSETSELANRFDYNIRDLFYWEQKMGNWGTMFSSELDIAIEEFYPFGTRTLIETFLSVRKEDRPLTDSKVHRRMIEILWSDVLKEPINPHKNNLPIRRLMKIFLMKIGMLRILKSALRNFKHKKVNI